jgi:hypothetical protein
MTIEAERVRTLSRNTTIGELVGTAGLGSLMPFCRMSASRRQKRPLPSKPVFDCHFRPGSHRRVPDPSIGAVA